MYYLGFDVHKDDSHVAVLDDNGKVVQEGRIQNTSLNKVAEEYVGSKTAIEATGIYHTCSSTRYWRSFAETA